MLSTKVKFLRTVERMTKARKKLLVDSVRTYLVPAILAMGFCRSSRTHKTASGQENNELFPFGLMERARADGGVDLLEIQFSTYQRAAFRINACAVPREGLMTAVGQRTSGQLYAAGLHAHFETHAHPLIRSIMKNVGLEPCFEWFSVWPQILLFPARYTCINLAKKGAKVLPEIDLALQGGKPGPHIRWVDLGQPFADDVLERIQKYKQHSKIEEP